MNCVKCNANTSLTLEDCPRSEAMCEECGLEHQHIRGELTRKLSMVLDAVDEEHEQVLVDIFFRSCRRYEIDPHDIREQLIDEYTSSLMELRLI
jgi:transcription elongation factor Elf1